MIFPSRYMPCEECGASIERGAEHVCQPERALDYQLFQLRDETGRLEDQVAAYLASPRGRFELWYAERERAA